MVDYNLAKLTLWLTATVLIEAVNITIVSVRDSFATLPCKIAVYDYPRWVGPDNINYNYQGSAGFNQYALPAEKYSRLKWATNTKDLKIENVTLQDSGVYYCVVDSNNYYARLEVTAQPDPPLLFNITYIENMRAILCVQDQSVAITCVSRGGYPEPLLDIYIGPKTSDSSKRVAVEADNSFTVIITSTFIAVRENDGVNVTCQSSYNQSDTKSTTSAILYLSLKPSVPVISGIHTATEGSSVELQCTAADSRPPVNISWILETITASQMESTVYDDTYKTFTVTSYLKTRALEKADNKKNITCIVSHETLFSQIAVSQLLDVQFAPNTLHLSGNRLITANKKNVLTLRCKSSSSNPVSNLTWIQNGGMLTSITSDTQTGGDFGGIAREQNVTITPTRSMDGDMIFCIAEHYLLKKSQQLRQNITLDLNYESITVITDGHARTVTEGQSTVMLSCYANSKPPSTFLWLKDNDPVMSVNGTTDDNNALYTITSVNRTHAGEYTCLADNGIGSSHSSSIRLTVQYPPDVTVFTTNTTVNDTSVAIKCAATGVPSTYVFHPWRQTWPGTTMVIKNTINPSEKILTILHPSYQDTGVYTCFVENGVSVWDTNRQMTSASVYLLVESYPIVTMPTNEAGDDAHKILAKLNIQFTYNISFYSNSGDVQFTFYRPFNNTKVHVPVSKKIASTDVKLRVYETEIQTKGRTLTILHTVREEDQFGLLNVDISNHIGTSTVSLEIISEEKVPGSEGTTNGEAIGAGAGAGAGAGVVLILAVGVFACVFVWYRRHTSSQLLTNDSGTAHAFCDSEHADVNDKHDTHQENVYQNLMLNTLDTPAGMRKDNQTGASITDATEGVYEELSQRILHENSYSTLSARRDSKATNNLVIEMAAYQSNAVSTDASPTIES